MLPKSFSFGSTLGLKLHCFGFLRFPRGMTFKDEVSRPIPNIVTGVGGTGSVTKFQDEVCRVERDIRTRS